MAACLLFGGVAQAASDRADVQPTQEQMEIFLRGHPEIILDVLRDHGEEVLDIVQQGAEKRRRHSLLSQWEADMKQPKNIALKDRPAGGAEDAPVTLVAFSDFLCTYCHQAAFTLGTLMKRYPGKIRLVFKQVPKNEAGRIAGSWFLAAYDQDKAMAWKMYAVLFDRQNDLEADPEATLRAVAAETGLDVSRIEADLAEHGGKYAAILDEDSADAKALGFAGTPYFLVNDMIIRGSLPLENFVDAVELALKNVPAQ